MTQEVKVGDRFGRWEVIDTNPSNQNRSNHRGKQVVVRCDCGTKRLMAPSRLTGMHMSRQCQKCARKASKRTGFGSCVATTCVPGDHV